jgi:hypothetical protein
MLTDSDMDRLVAGVLVQAVADAGSKDPELRDDARSFLRRAAPSLAQKLEAHGWRVGSGRRVHAQRILHNLAA